MTAARAFLLALLCVCWTSGCNHPQAPDDHPRYIVGPAWQSDGFWFYPAESSSYAETGLAVTDSPQAGLRRRTADGERYDPARLTGSHQTLQLPAILRVRNLENGREILLRINDRGPASPGRLLSVSPHAAWLLNMDPDRPTRVSVTLDQALSDEILAGLDGAPSAQIEAAPVADVQEEQLVPPDGASAGNHPPLTANARASPPLSSVSTLGPGLALPDRVTLNWPAPGRLWIDAGRFSVASYAAMLAGRIGGQVRRSGYGRNSVFELRVGPFDQVPDADAALDRVRSAGVTGAVIVVE